MSPPERSFAGWVPIHIFRSPPQPIVLWSRLGARRFDEPFFDQTVTGALQSPLAKLLQRHTSLDELVAIAERAPALEPTGFIFHVSRCGSTLVSQMFARLPRVIVISEARPLTTALEDLRLSDTDRRRAFRALIRLYGRPGGGGETDYIIKFEPRNTLDWRVIADLHPHVPRVVLYREPVEVIVSNQMLVSEAAMPGAIDPARLGPLPFPITSHEEYAAFVFSRIFAHAVEVAQVPGSLVVDYRDLPDAVEARIAPHFRLPLSGTDRTALRAATRLYAKDASRSAEFTPDSAEKQASADAALRALCAALLDPFCEQLRRL